MRWVRFGNAVLDAVSWVLIAAAVAFAVAGVVANAHGQCVGGVCYGPPATAGVAGGPKPGDWILTPTGWGQVVGPATPAGAPLAKTESAKTEPAKGAVDPAKAAPTKLEPGGSGEPPLLTGVMRDRIAGESGYRLNGRDVPRELVRGAVAAKGVPDDARKHRITIIGPTEARKLALASLPNDVRDWAVVVAYDPSHWYPKANGFRTDGHPTVYVQKADGTVIHRQDDLKDLDRAIGRANPNYDPAKDPDLRKSPEPAKPAPAPAPAPGPTPADPAAPSTPSLDDTKKVGAGAVGAFILMLLVRYGIPFAVEWFKNRKKPSETDAAILDLLKKLSEKKKDDPAK